MTNRTWLAITGALAVGFVLGHWRGTSTVERVAPAASVVPAAPATRIVERHSSAAGITTSDVRAAVREEVAALLAAERGEPAAVSPEPPPTDEQLVLEAKAHEVLGAAIAAGRLTTRDDTQLNVLIAQLPRTQQQAVIGALVDAINTRQVMLELN